MRNRLKTTFAGIGGLGDCSRMRDATREEARTTLSSLETVSQACYGMDKRKPATPTKRTSESFQSAAKIGPGTPRLAIISYVVSVISDL